MFIIVVAPLPVPHRVEHIFLPFNKQRIFSTCPTCTTTTGRVGHPMGVSMGG
jgi:hypothetical protein